MMRTFKMAAARLAALAALALVTAEYALAEKASEPVPGIEPDETLSEQLHEDKGVITPPSIGDEGIHADVPDPDAGHEEEVIPPPGSPGGDQSVEPK
jgi:hypothetical protein